MPIIQKVNRESPTSGILSRIKSVEEQEEDFIKLSVYGQSGSGKTTFWSTFPKPILAMICSGAAETLSIRNVKQIDQVELEKPEDVREICQHVSKTNKYKTVVLDHASAFQDLILANVLNLKEAPTQIGWGTATQQQWGQVSLQMKEYLRQIIRLSANVVIVAQERAFNADEESSVLKPYVGSAISPSILNWLNPTVDYVCQTYLRQGYESVQKQIGSKTVEKKVPSGRVQYCLRTAPDPIYTTKFRILKGMELPECIVDPSYEKVVSLIK